MDKVQKIREEVERLKNKDFSGTYDARYALDLVATFINSLPEEPEFTINKDVSQMADEFAEREYEFDGYERKWLSKGYYHGYMDANKSKPEEPVSEGICNQCKAHNDKDKCDELVFGHNCPIVTTSEDLEEASEEYTSKVLERTNVLIGNQPVGEEIEAAFRAGAEWADCHQAEKDFELTWEDVKAIFLLVQVEWSPNKNEEEIYQEVLRRFNEERNK